MATIEKRSDSAGALTYRVKVRIKGFPAQTSTFERLSDAKKWAAKIETELREHRHFGKDESRKHTVSEMLQRYEKEILERNPKKKRNDQHKLDWWREQIGAYRLCDVTPALLVQCRERLAQEPTTRKTPMSSSTLNRYRTFLAHTFTVAVREWEWIQVNPVTRLKKLQEPREIVRYLDKQEREALLQACRLSKNPFLETIVTLAMSTGMRKNEILYLCWKDVDLPRGLLVVEDSKNKDRRSVPIVKEAHALLLKHSKVRRLDSDFVFPREDGKKPIDITKAWRTAIVKAEIKNFRFHDLRHTAASYLAMSGASLPEIGALLGHRSVQTTKRYAHLSTNHLSEVVERMRQRIFR